MKTKAFIRHLTYHNCHFVKHGKKHDKWQNADGTRTSRVGRHPTIKDRMAEVICDQLGIAKP